MRDLPLFLDKDKALRSMTATSPLGTFFGISQKVYDTVWKHLTAPAGQSVTYISMEIGADRDVFHPVRDRLMELGITESTDPVLDKFAKMFLTGPSKIPNYSGGLGILAGDTLKSFACCRIPALAISLFYRRGYFCQLVDSKVGQICWSGEWQPENTSSLYLLQDPEKPGMPMEIEVPFFDRRDQRIMAHAQLWMKLEVNNSLDYFVPEILLDYGIAEAPEYIREAGKTLYDSSSERTQAIQRRLLGAAIIPTMRALGVTSKTLHLNEQHGVAVVLHMIAEDLHAIYGDRYQEEARDQDITDAAGRVAEKIVYTIHTPVKAGHDRFSREMYKDIGHSFCQRILRLLATDPEYPESYNFTAMAMRVNRATNSVSRLHKIVTQKQFPQYAKKITAITNGVHHLTWVSEARAELYDAFPELENWRDDPGVFVNAGGFVKNKKFRVYLDQAMRKDTNRLISYVNQMLMQHRAQRQETWIDPPNYLSHLDGPDTALHPEVFTIGFARRFSTYKRADLIFEDIDRLSEMIVANNWPVNFIFAGKAHPADEPGKYLIKLILDSQKELYEKSRGMAKLVFIPNYDMYIAKMMVAGVHAWLNSPKRPLEASGTSGMKAAINGVPNISILDGWWAEGYHDGRTGWKFGYEAPVDTRMLSEHPDELLYAEDSDSFYEIFPEILKSFYAPNLRPDYLEKSIMNLALNLPIFNTHRMAAEYLSRYDLKLSPEITRRINALAKLYRSDQEDTVTL